MNNIETITQLFAAIYITLAVDIQFFQRFWSQTYYNTVTKIICQYKFNSSTRIEKDLMSYIKNQAILLERLSRKRGILMFCFCFIILVYASFENSNYCNYTHGYIRLIPFSFFTLIVALFNNTLLKSFRRSLIVIIILLCILLIPYQTKLDSIIIENLNIELAKIFVICTLVLPILWQLVSNWLYSSIYKKYLIQLLNKEADDYKNTIIAKREKNKNKLPASYTSVLASFSITGETDTDIQITEINNVLCQRLKEACKYPKYHKLLKFITKNSEEVKPINNNLRDVHLNYNEHVNNSISPNTKNWVTQESKNNIKNKKNNINKQKRIFAKKKIELIKNDKIDTSPK